MEQRFSYNSAGLLDSITGPSGRKLILSYYPSGQLAYLLHPDGNQTLYEYDGIGNLVKVIHPDETQQILEDNPTTQYFYEDALHPYALTRQVDANGDTYATWSFDSTGRATGSSNFEGHRAGTISYDVRSTTVTEASGHERTLSFDNKGRLTAMTGGNCGQCDSSDVASYTYDSKNQLTAKTDFNGSETRYKYNARGLETERVEGYGTQQAKTIFTQWHQDFALPTSITYPSKRIIYTYGVRGRLESIERVDLTTAEQVSAVTTFSYDEKNDLTSITDAAGNTVTIATRNENGFPTRIIGGNGEVTTMDYDARNRLVESVVNGNVTTFAYDHIGQLVSVTLPNGVETKYHYNGARLLTTLTDNAGNTVNYHYDDMGNVTQVDIKDPTENLYSTQKRVYDELNRLISQVDGMNNQVDFGYDAVGNVVTVNRPLGQDTQRVFDAHNRLIEVIDAKDNSTLNDYDAADNLIKVEAANGAITTYSYDGFGRIIKQSSRDTGITQYMYDVAGNRIQRVNANNVKVGYSYDALNRLTAIDYPDDDLDVSLTYGGGTLGKGVLTSIQDGSGETQYTHNNLGQVATKTVRIEEKSFLVSYSYNSVGKITTMTYPSGRMVSFAYDSNGKVSAIRSEKEGGEQVLLSSAAYAPFGSAKSFIQGNGQSTNRAFNLNGQISTINVADTLELAFSYSKSNNILTISDGVTPEQSQSFTYDVKDRIVKARGEYGTLDYDYDEAGNRLSGPSASNLQYKESSNQLLSPYIHDPAGNRIRDLTRVYSYSENNRLTEVVNESNGLTTTYLYNGLGQRVKKSNIFGDIYFIYDEDGLLISEADENGNVIKEYVYFEGQPLALLVGE